MHNNSNDINRFIRDAFFSILVGIAALIPFEILCGYEDNEYSQKRNYIETHSDEIKILLMGNSLFSESFNPLVIRDDSIFCLAISGRVLYYDVQLLEKYINTLPNL